MSLTTNQITAAIRRKILEESTDLVSDATILLNANLAYDDLKINSFTNDQIKSATVAIVSGTGTLPADFGTLYGVGYQSSTDKSAFEEKSIADFYREENGVNGVTVEGGFLRVNPNTTASILIKYYPSYDALTTIQDPQLNGFLHELIIYGAIYRILQDLQDEERAEYYRSYYKEEVKTKISSLSNYQEDNANGGSLFNYVRLI